MRRIGCIKVKITIKAYDHIQQQYLLENKNQQEIAKGLSISRNTVTKYCKGGAYPVFMPVTLIPLSDFLLQVIQSPCSDIFFISASKGFQSNKQ